MRCSFHSSTGSLTLSAVHRARLLGHLLRSASVVAGKARLGWRRADCAVRDSLKNCSIGINYIKRCGRQLLDWLDLSAAALARQTYAPREAAARARC